MNQPFRQTPQDHYDPEITPFNIDKVQYQQYFQNLEHKLISKSNKISNFMGSTYAPKLIKTQSLQQNYEEEYSPLPKNYRKFIQSSSVSPVKKKSQVLAKRTFQIEPKSSQNTIKLVQVNTALQKLIKLKQNLIQKKNYSRSSASSGQNQRIIAYDYDFTLPDLGPKPRQTIQKRVIKNAKQILKGAYQQKKKMTQTISTTASFQFPKINQPLLQKKQSSEACLNDFQLLKPLGEGKFGTVFLARHKQSNFLCALKKIPKLFEDQSIVQQLTREIKIQSFLDHPNICQLYTYFAEGQFIYLVLQLCYSGNVYTILRKQGRFTEDKVKSIIRQVCHAIQYLHEHDIIHRDIKPENIIFHENIVKLCDFGWSVHSPLSRGTLCGTPIYASPQLVLKKQYDGKIDIWNIGILTYQLFYGRVPFQIRCEEDLQKVIEQEIYFAKSIEISDQAKDFIRQCLNKNPQYRISIVKLLDHDFIFQKESRQSK